MAYRGQRKYRCDECGVESYFHWTALNRAARMRCPGCGSCRLELVSDQAKRERVLANRARVEGHRSMTHAVNQKPNHKVV